MNPEVCFLVETALLKELDGMSFFAMFRLTGKVVNLSQLKRTVTVNGKGVATDSLIIFDRQVFAADQDSSLEES